ncbi:hypothetical protein [Streptomyces sp. NBC_01716]|uniref:hypothetical protein n=1 Tax=Streptomyces sp. NBC_01716 TaxID=2975917 RepID=UPI002E32C790|nr:hypothetical protein [Streptomyces sp. NBC_01716]
MRGTTATLCLATALLLGTGATGCSDDGEEPPLVVGATVTRELEGGGKAAYTLKGVTAPAEMKPGELTRLHEGRFWAALELEFENVGSKDIEERPQYRTDIGPREGEEPFGTTATGFEPVQGPALPGVVRLKPGESAEGYLVIEISQQGPVIGTVTYSPGRSGDIVWKVD